MIKYVPILRGKDGEFAALQNLEENILNQICPLIQFLPDRNKDRKGDYLTKITSEAIDAWNFDGNQMYFDPSFIDDANFISRLVQRLRENGINIIPVIQPNSNRGYLELIKHGYTDNGILIRLKKAYATPQELKGVVDATLTKYGIDPARLDILFDLQYINSEDSIPIFQNTIMRLFDSLKIKDGCRRIIVGAGSFPSDVTDFPVNVVSPIPRIEWMLWRKIKQELKDITLTYADYGNVHPLYDPLIKAFEGSCSIKYTSKTRFYIFRGVKPSGHIDGGGQYHQKSRELIQNDVYDGRDFSWGDDCIHKCANHELSSGNAGTWVKYTLNHHFMKVLSLL